MDTLSGPVGPGPQGPETGQAWHGPTQWVFPLGPGVHAPGFWTCFATQRGSRGGAGVAGKRAWGWSPEFVLELLLGLV